VWIIIGNDEKLNPKESTCENSRYEAREKANNLEKISKNGRKFGKIQGITPHIISGVMALISG